MKYIEIRPACCFPDTCTSCHFAALGKTVNAPEKSCHGQSTCRPQQWTTTQGATCRKAKSGLLTLSVSLWNPNGWGESHHDGSTERFLATLAAGQTFGVLFRTKLVLFGMKPSDAGRPSKPETGAASNDSITCQWCLIATGLERNLLKTCILSMHAEMITKIMWDSNRFHFLRFLGSVSQGIEVFESLLDIQ